MAQLQPLRVPWQVSPSISAFDYRVTYMPNGCHHCNITFDGGLGEATKLRIEHGTHAKVTVAFTHVVYTKFFPDYSNEDKSRIDAYDWDLVPPFPDSDGSYRGAIRNSLDEWNATDICPDPGFLLVKDSELPDRVGVDKDVFNHYLFLGDEFKIEVVATEFTWELGESVPIL